MLRSLGKTDPKPYGFGGRLDQASPPTHRAWGGGEGWSDHSVLSRFDEPLRGSSYPLLEVRLTPSALINPPPKPVGFWGGGHSNTPLNGTRWSCCVAPTGGIATRQRTGHAETCCYALPREAQHVSQKWQILLHTFTLLERSGYVWACFLSP